ncbi:hypothetical protein VPH35_004436 [Triticum aestivum]
MWRPGSRTSTAPGWCTGTSRRATSSSAPMAEPSSQILGARGRREPVAGRSSAARRRSWRPRWRAARSRAPRPTSGRSAAWLSRWPLDAGRGAAWTATRSRRCTGSATRRPCPRFPNGYPPTRRTSWPDALSGRPAAGARPSCCWSTSSWPRLPSTRSREPWRANWCRRRARWTQHSGNRIQTRMRRSTTARPR